MSSESAQYIHPIPEEKLNEKAVYPLIFVSEPHFERANQRRTVVIDQARYCVGQSTDAQLLQSLRQEENIRVEGIPEFQEPGEPKTYRELIAYFREGEIREES